MIVEIDYFENLSEGLIVEQEDVNILVLESIEMGFEKLVLMDEQKLLVNFVVECWVGDMEHFVSVH
jgi:hypothetical protein